MSLTTWVFKVSADGKVSRISRSAYERFCSREEPAPQHEGAEFLTVLVALEVESRKPVCVNAAHFNRYALDSGGYWDEAHCVAAQRLALSVVDGLMSDALPQGNVTPAVPHIARRRLAVDHHWDPTPEVLGALTRHLNRKAGVELVGHDGRELISYRF